MSALARARAWLFDLTAHNHAEQLRIQRAVQRQKLGVDQQEYPYPGAVQGSNNPVIHYNTGTVRGAILAAALLAAGGGGVAALVGLTPRAGTTPPATSAAETHKQASVPNGTVPTKEVVDPHWDAIYEEQQPDGSWKTIKREHLK